ncbi:Glutathione S-transferase, C-terminal domain [Popillia japonica]|uniref:Glutathione S-transferase, C-terminal domain n=1 Tax=Popillia japonica TaxID=7064 RepID=A0AAW1N3C3_POPJA
MSKTVQYLSQIAAYLQVPSGKITFDSFSLPVRTHNNTSVTGFLNIILAYLKESKLDVLLGKTPEDKAEIYQWIEYADLYLQRPNASQIINEHLPRLNGVLLKKTYLASNKLTIADVVLYYVLLSVMANISHIEKEKFVNISRWYDNLQQDDLLRQGNSLINFNTSFLCIIAPAHH